MTTYQRINLRRGLLAGENAAELDRLYRDNPEFYTGINTLVGVLPIFVEALAKHSVEQAARVEQMTKLIEQGDPQGAWRLRPPDGTEPV